MKLPIGQMQELQNAKAEECTTPYMRQNIGVGGLHGNQVCYK